MCVHMRVCVYDCRVLHSSSPRARLLLVWLECNTECSHVQRKRLLSVLPLQLKTLPHRVWNFPLHVSLLKRAHGSDLSPSFCGIFGGTVWPSSLKFCTYIQGRFSWAHWYCISMVKYWNSSTAFVKQWFSWVCLPPSCSPPPCPGTLPKIST